MPDQLQGIVQRMIDAGESEDNIATVIQHFKTQGKPGEAAPMTQGVLGHPLGASDETPSFKDRLVGGFVDNPMIQGGAHPQTLGDVTSLLLPSLPIAPIKAAARAGINGAIRTAAAVGDEVNPKIIGMISPKWGNRVKYAQEIRDTMDKAKAINTAAPTIARSTDSTARVLEPVAEAESVARPMDMNAPHLDRSVSMRPSEMTEQQLAERVQFGHGTPAQVTGRIVTRAPMEPVPSHAPTVDTSLIENAERRARQILPEIKPVDARVPTGYGTQPDNLLETLPDESPMQQPRVDIGAERVGRAQGLTTDQVRAQTAPILGEAPGTASPILPEKALQSIIDKMRTLPRGGPEREAYVQAATSGKAQWQIENIRRTLEHLGLLVPAAAAVSPDVRGMLIDRMRAGVTGRDSQ